jgi:chromate transporter
MSESAADAPQVVRPTSPADLFRAFNRLALQGFGGVLPVAQRELVENERWMSKAEFLELLSIGQVLPGPNIVNMALIFGDRFFGWRGAFAALAGLMVVPLLIVLVLAIAVQQGAGSPLMNDALRGMGVVAAGLIVSTAARLWSALKANRMGLTVCIAYVAVTVFAVGVMRWPLVAVLLGVGPLAWLTAWWALR